MGLPAYEVLTALFHYVEPQVLSVRHNDVESETVAGGRKRKSSTLHIVGVGCTLLFVTNTLGLKIAPIASLPTYSSLCLVV